MSLLDSSIRVLGLHSLILLFFLALGRWRHKWSVSFNFTHFLFDRRDSYSLGALRGLVSLFSFLLGLANDLEQVTFGLPHNLLPNPSICWTANFSSAFSGFYSWGLGLSIRFLLCYFHSPLTLGCLATE